MDGDYLYKLEENIENLNQQNKNYYDESLNASKSQEIEESKPLYNIIESFKISQTDTEIIQNLNDLLNHKFTFDDNEMSILENSDLIPNLVGFFDSESQEIQKLSLFNTIRITAMNSDASCLLFESGVCKAASKFLKDEELMRYALCIYLNIMSHDSLMAKRIERIFPVSEAKNIIDTHPNQILLNTLIRYIFQMIAMRKPVHENNQEEIAFFSYCIKIFQDLIESDVTDSIVLVLSCLRKPLVEHKFTSILSQNPSFVHSILHLIGHTKESSVLSNALIYAGIFAKLKLVTQVSKSLLHNIIFYSHSPNNLVQSTALWCLSELANERVIPNPVDTALKFIITDLESLQNETTSIKQDATFFVTSLLKQGETGDYSDLFSSIDIFALYSDFKDFEDEKTIITILESLKHMIEIIQKISPETDIQGKLTEFEYKSHIDEWMESENSRISLLGEFFNSFFEEK